MKQESFGISREKFNEGTEFEVVIRVLDFAQQYTSSMDWGSYENALSMLKKAYAFEDPNTAELKGIQLVLPKM